ncbi:MAG: ribosome-associated translation inhibitor RaiA [Prevotellaceae bacterium]|jgi:putative sigma-54 modulation protein|nr:ribosome-associated translation inhibitor RaiA [Prevotellaceae bacterium]
MNVKIQSIKFTADKNLLAFIEDKVGKLDRFYDGIVGAEVALSLENVSDDKNKVAKIRLVVPGNDMFAEHQCKSFEEAVDMNVEVLKKQLAKHKDKERGK